MVENLHQYPHASSLKHAIKEETKQWVADCYQCGKCAAGCPVADITDMAPNQVIRQLQVGDEKHDNNALQSMHIWLCLTCETCAARCPQDVEFPVIADYLRQKAYDEKVYNKEAKDIVAFHESFLNSVKTTGKLFEVGMVAQYKMKTFNLMQDVKNAPIMFMKGKLGLLPHNVKNKEAIKRMFEKAEAKNNSNGGEH